MVGLLLPSVANATAADDTLYSAVDSLNATQLGPVGAEYQGTGGKAAFYGRRTNRESIIDNSASGRDKITSEVASDYVLGGIYMDAGAGAGLNLSFSRYFHKTETSMESRPNQDPRVELMTRQHGEAKLHIELTSELRASADLRVLEHRYHVIGDPFLNPDLATDYRSSFVGYRGSLAYDNKSTIVSYMYSPPLHGKALVSGEEKLVNDPGFLMLSAGHRLSNKGGFGARVKRSLDEPDELALGTTAGDDSTKISLYGLDPDQYARLWQLSLLGFAFPVTPKALASVTLGQEIRRVNTNDYFVYQRADWRAPTNQKMVSYLWRLGLTADYGNFVANLGVGGLSRAQSFPTGDRKTEYKSGSQEMVAALALKI